MDTTKGKPMTYNVGDRVVLTYNDFDLVTDEFKGKKTAIGKVTRVWSNQKTITIRVNGKSIFVRSVDSPNVRKD
jgi:hypothetical protein